MLISLAQICAIPEWHKVQLAHIARLPMQRIKTSGFLRLKLVCQLNQKINNLFQTFLEE